MSRMKINALTTVIEAAEGAGYTLPVEVLDAHRTHAQLKELTAPDPEPVHFDTLAARLVSAAAAAGTVDLMSLGRSYAEAESARGAAEHARQILTEAIEQAANAAAYLCADLTETIITEHLRPAHSAILNRTSEVQDILDGYGLDAHRIITAPTKVRNAYLELPGLVARYAAILNARRLLNVIGDRAAQHDHEGLFADFAEPLTFSPDWKPPARISRLPYPVDPTERLLWIAGPEATKAKPWLPTVAEQDAAWWATFGEAQERRAQAAMSARAHAGQRV